IIAYLIHVPEATDGGDGIEVVAAYEAEDDHTERDPWEMARKEVAKSMEHLVKVGQSRHRSPPLVEDCIEENDRMLALFFQLSFVLQSKFGLDHGVGHPSYLWARPKPLSTGGRSRTLASCGAATRGRRGDRSRKFYASGLN